MQFLKVDDAVLHYQVIGGPARAPAVVFVNALGTDFRIWRDVVVRLASKYTLLTYDMRGHGLSQTGEGAVTMDRHAEDLAAIMDHVGLTSAVICGISAGGMVAQQLYAERRDLVSALILCATAARIGDAEAWNQRIATVEANGLAPVAQSLMAKWFTPGFIHANAAEVAGYRTMVERQPSAGYIATCAAIRDADLGDAARSIGVPALCIAADQDGSVPAEAVEALARSIPAARLETIAGAGHLFCVEQAERTAVIIETFLRLLKPDTTAH